MITEKEKTGRISEGDRVALVLGIVPTLVFYPLALWAAFAIPHLSNTPAPGAAGDLSLQDVAILMMLASAGGSFVFAGIAFYGETHDVSWKARLILVVVQILAIGALVGANLFAARA